MSHRGTDLRWWNWATRPVPADRAGPEHCARLGMMEEGKKNQEKKRAPCSQLILHHVSSPPHRRQTASRDPFSTGRYFGRIHGRKLRFWAANHPIDVPCVGPEPPSRSSTSNGVFRLFRFGSSHRFLVLPLAHPSAVVRSSRPRAATPGAGQIASPVTAIGRSVNVCKALHQ